MSEGMFDSPLWLELSSAHVLALRACAPYTIWTLSAKEAYLDQVSERADLADIAEAIFSDDHTFVTGLPVMWRSNTPELIALCKLAYGRGIRTPDSRVKNM